MVSQNVHPQSSAPLLAELAALYGVRTEYRDLWGNRQISSRDSVLAALRALGAQVHPRRGKLVGEARLRAAIEARHAELRERLVEPVVVAWDGMMPPGAVRTSTAGRADVETVLTLEGGEEWPPRGARGLHVEPRGTGRSGRERLPFGYHRLRVQSGKEIAEATVISAPRHCWSVDASSGREWGVFAPLYSLRSDRDWGAGDLTELEHLQESVGAAGGTAVSTLPMLAAYLDDPFEPAPYRPVSRLFWNEFYLAVDQIAEWEQCGSARDAWASAPVQAQIARYRSDPLVDYRGVMAAKRRVLEELSRWFFEHADASRRAAFAEYERDHAEAGQYAAFRARTEPADDDPEVTHRYHLYCQWQMEEQLARLAEGTAPGLFLDMPVGVHPRGFDTWRWPELFADGVSFGAPPDDFFASGQDWDTPPLRPEASREQGHRYFRECVRHHMRHARYLRIDHIMALHRLFWIPQGREPVDGVYVTYPAEELYAILSLESNRSRTAVVGEDLGTVPPEVRPTMRRHRVLGMWVLQTSLRPRAERPLREVPRHTSAALGTHDMFPFAAFVRGDDIAARQQREQIDTQLAYREIAARKRLIERLVASLSASGPRSAAPADLLRATLEHLLSGVAALVVINLDDLLLETQPQNRPGTGPEWDNWRRKVAASAQEVRRAILRVSGLVHDRGGKLD